MAWVAKQSGTMKIERRSTPYLTQTLKDRLTRDVLPRYEVKKGAIMPTLHAVQHEHGWLPMQALEEVAAFLDLEPADVYDTATFYEEYWLKPKGRHVIAVCRSIACEFCNNKQITDACREKLGVEVGDTTPDGRFTLIELECLGACGGAPAALIDETLHENLSPEKIVRLIDETKDNHKQH